MTGILNFFEHIGNYAGVGMVMLLIGLCMIIIAIISLAGLRRAERSRTVAEFNRQFVSDTRFRISDVDAGAARKEIAGRLDIR